MREGGREARVLFSGDVGRFDTIVARDPDTAAATLTQHLTLTAAALTDTAD